MNFLIPVDGGIITQRFGENALDYRVFGIAGHNGLDFGVGEGTPVRAAAAGRVARASMDGSGYGLHVRIEHAENTLSLYGHLSKLNVKQGQDVRAGDVIGLSGNTGNSTGPHLHFEVRRPGGPEGYGGAVDPWPLLFGEEQVLYQVRVLPEQGLNLRAAPQITAQVVGAAVCGSILNVYEERGGWVRVDPSPVWACAVFQNDFLLMRVSEPASESWAAALDRWARSKGFDGPRP